MSSLASPVPHGPEAPVGHAGSAPSAHAVADAGWFALTTLCTSVLHVALHAAGFALIMRRVAQAFPAGSPEFVHQLHRGSGELVIWAMVVTSLTMGLFITTVMRWSGARTVAQGLGRGALLGLLFWTAVNSGLYASSRLFSLPAVLADTPLSALYMALAATFAVWMLNVRRGRG